MPSQDEVIAALRAREVGPPTVSMMVPQAVQALSQPGSQVAGDVVRPPLMMFNSGGSPDDLYSKVLQQPSGAAAIRQQGGAGAKPQNVLPISPSVQQQMGAVSSPMQVAENTAVDWQNQPLRTSNGAYTSPNGPLQVIGPAQFRNSMRSIGLKPPEYNKKE